MNGRQIVGQIQAQMFANHGHSCPNCGQQNVKVRNALLYILDSNEIVRNCMYYTALTSTYSIEKIRGRKREGKLVLFKGYWNHHIWMELTNMLKNIY